MRRIAKPLYAPWFWVSIGAFAAASLAAGYLAPCQASNAEGPSSYLQEILSYPDTVKLPWFVARTVFRMALAYGLALGFGLSYGIVAGMQPRASEVMVPILDVLQSVPVLGYLPAVLYFFTGLFKGSVVGSELASIILIFTGMAWSITFGVYGAVRTIPHDLIEAARVFKLGGAAYLKHLVLPAIYPAVISGSILAWGGGWYFLIVCEYASFGPGTPPIELPGLGNYLYKAALAGNMPVALFGLAVMTLIVVVINRLVWHPLMDHAEKFRYETTMVPVKKKPAKGFRRTIARVVRRELGHAVRPVVEMEERYWRSALRFRMAHPLPHPHLHLHGRRFLHWGRVVGASAAVLFLVSTTALAMTGSLSFPSLDAILSHFEAHSETRLLPYYTARSIARLAAGYFIALAWTLSVGVLLARRERLSNILMPLFDVGQSIPAMALFPIVVVVVISYFHEAPFAVELASILLVLTGMQWYLLFNIVGAVESIPGDVLEAAEAFGFRGLKLIRHVVLPAIFPVVIVGSIQAWGGGWNASIASEFIQYGEKTYIAEGLGAFLDLAAWEWSDTVLVIVSVTVMAAVIVAMNRTVWRYLFKRSERYRFEQ